MPEDERGGGERVNNKPTPDTLIHPPPSPPAQQNPCSQFKSCAFPPLCNCEYSLSLLLISMFSFLTSKIDYFLPRKIVEDSVSSACSVQIPYVPQSVLSAS